MRCVDRAAKACKLTCINVRWCKCANNYYRPAQLPLCIEPHIRQVSKLFVLYIYIYMLCMFKLTQQAPGEQASMFNVAWVINREI